MKIIYFIILFCTLGNLNAQHKVIYEIRPAKTFDILKNLKSDNPFTNKQINKINRAMNEERVICTLETCDNGSRFSYLKTVYPNDLQDVKRLINYIPTCFKDFGMSTFELSGGNTSEDYIVIDDLIKYNKWKFVAEDTLISNWRCLKAINEVDNTVAWYAPDIPISDGPYHYGLLPGIIVCLQKKEFIVELISIEVSTNDCDYSSREKGGVAKISYSQYLNDIN